MAFSYNIFRQDDDVVLAISDTSILGKTFREKDLQLYVSEDFYSGNECDREKAIELISTSTIVNAVGREIVDLLIEKNIINNGSVLVIDDVPHVQIITMK